MRLLVFTIDHFYMKSKYNITKKNQRTFKKKIVGILLKVFLISMYLFTFQSCDLKLDEEVVYPAIVLNDSIVGLTDTHKFLEVDTLYFTPGQTMYFYPYCIREGLSYYGGITSDFTLNGNDFKPNSGYGNYFTMPDIPGTYYLTAKINCFVTMGSIANITGESYLFEKKWGLIIYEFDESPSYVNYHFENGRVKVEWEECPLPFIKEYRIYDSYDSDRPLLIGTTSKNYFIDSAYMGNKIYRKIKAVTKGNTEVAWGGYIVEKDFPQ